MKKFSKAAAVILAIIMAAGLFAATVSADTNPCSSFYHIYYDGNGSTGGSQTDSSEYDFWQKAIVKGQGTLLKTGYSFSDWNTESDGSGDSYAPGYEIDFVIGVISYPGFWFWGIWIPGWDEPVYGDKVLYAQWTINQFTMTFDSEGGSNVASVTQDYNTTVTQPASPTKEGYTFAGWYTGDGGTGSPVAFPYTLTEDITVYAKWNINYYTMMFDSEGGTSVSPVTQAYNTKIAAPTSPTRYGFTFDGWYTGSLGTGTKISFPYTIKNNITVHAKWLANTYTLKFDSEGGSAVASQTRYYGEYVNSPANPTKDGYTFEGWYLGDNGTGSKAVFPYNIVGNATVYAKWSKNEVVEVSVPAASSTPATPSIPSTTTISSTPAPTSVPDMGGEVNTVTNTVIILSVLVISGIAVLGYRKLRAEK
ncbi:MAG TPA: InlB B-repeat-containing protein [Oscillospiraceae bacterium]|nr:InlB B-repeat-containing protein [Oscillospiraceae bacterium]HPK34677.1 InlB B-repeat-containing protein [Oscillospiraceae bacterium]HPR74559.1 InlB B-repeat-containing protein [Oscillospiraceae bacterium]